jgi:hypothetical protein
LSEYGTHKTIKQAEREESEKRARAGERERERSRPSSGLGCQAKVLQIFEGLRSWLLVESGWLITTPNANCPSK